MSENSQIDTAQPKSPQKINRKSILILVFAGILLTSGIVTVWLFLNQPTTPPTKTLNWKTYSNQSFGFSIKYPTNWATEESKELHAGASQFIVFSSPDKSAWHGIGDYATRVSSIELTVSVRKADRNSLEEIKGRMGEFKNFKYITIDGVKALKGVFFPWEGGAASHIIRVVALKNNKEYRIGITSYKDDFGQSEKILNSALSTFKFLN